MSKTKQEILESHFGSEYYTIKEIEPHILAAMDEYASTLESRIRELEAWKESAMRVMNEIDLQECRNVLGVPLGQSISTEILPGLKKMRDALEKIIDLYPNNDRDGRPVIALNDIRQTAFNALNP